MKSQIVRRVPLGGLLIMLAACAGNPTAPATDSAAPKEAAEYHIGAGDQLNIFVWNHPELSVTVPVRPDGLITTPLVEKLLAAGRTPSQLSRDLEVALSEYVRSPKVNVMVTQFVGSYGDQVRVVGQAAKPQSLAFRANMTLLDAMIQVGGLGEFAAGNRARVVRQVNGQSVTIPVRLKDLLNDGDTSKNIPLMPGDVIIIPETRF
jgi:polysaccharide export outer membrane protein